MDSVFGVIIALTVLSIIFYLLGTFFCKRIGKEETLSFRFLMGFVWFLAIFALVELPIELSGMPFHVLFYVETGIFIALSVGCVFFLRCGKENQISLKKPDDMTVVLLFLLGLQVLYVMNNGARINGYDTSYYNGHAINAIYTDTIYQYDARRGIFTGEESYVHDCYPMLMAVLAKCFGMHPLVVVNRVLSILEVVFANLTVYELARKLANGNRRIANWTVAFAAMISIFSYGYEETAGFYLWQRTAESKSMLANIYLPLVLLALVMLAKEIDNVFNWFVLGSVVLAGVTMSISGIFILSAMVGVGLLSIIICQKKWKYILHAGVCMVPGMIMGIIRLIL